MHFSIDGEEGLIFKTFFTQEMQKRGYIASTGLYASLAHSDELIDGYLQNVNEVFGNIHEIRMRGDALKNYLEAGVCHSGFERLN